MESRIARIESDVAHLKEDVSRIHVDLREIRNSQQATNHSLADLRAGQNALETRIIKWMIGMAIATASASFSIAKFLS